MSVFDLVVVGGGVAGWSAARRAQQLGGRVVVLERFAEGPGFGNGRLSGGWFHAAKLVPTRDPAELYQVIMDKTDGYARPDVARAWAENVGRAFAFLCDQGGNFQSLGLELDEEMQNALMPQRPAELGQKWQGAGPDNLLSAMWRGYVAAGGDFRAGHRATDLAVDEGRVVGVWADTASGRRLIEGHAVLLADGGFQGNKELVASYITSDYKLRGSVYDTGDALEMGLAVGGVAVNMEWFYGWPLCRDALTDDRLWPYPGPLGLISAGIVVDGAGRRFVDEGLAGERVADAIAKSATPGNCWVIFDAKIWDGPGRDGEVPINPTLVEVGGTVKSAATVSELALLVGLPEESLVTTVADVNRHVAGGDALQPPRNGQPWAVAESPFFAVPVIAGITFAMGGLLVNGHAQVLDVTGAAVAGLYAAGGTMGGLQGGPRSGYSGGWSEAATFGLLAAEHVCG